MTSIIKADNISTVSGSGNITIPTGVTLHSNQVIRAPNQVLQITKQSTAGNHNNARPGT